MRFRVKLSKAERKAIRATCAQIGNTPTSTVKDRWEKTFPAHAYCNGETRVWFPTGRTEQYPDIFAAGFTFVKEEVA